MYWETLAIMEEQNIPARYLEKKNAHTFKKTIPRTYLSSRKEFATCKISALSSSIYS